MREGFFGGNCCGQAAEEEARRAAEEAWIERQKAKRAEERKVTSGVNH